MIRRSEPEDFDAIRTVINDGAQAYQGVIPPDRWAEPYMSADKLRREIGLGVSFWVSAHEAEIQGVMGIQDVGDVTLIRHAYVRTSAQHRGIGSALLAHLYQLTDRPVLIGTWADAAWAIRFYQSKGFQQVDPQAKDRLLRTYWSVPERQIETSVVLVDERWRSRQVGRELHNKSS
jgi:GNAT superfamily N-acetyltransferase